MGLWERTREYTSTNRFGKMAFILVYMWNLVAPKSAQNRCQQENFGERESETKTREKSEKPASINQQI